MNQEQNNLNPNNFNTQGNNGMPNNQPLQNNQGFNPTFNQNVAPNTNVNQPTFNPQPMVELMQQPAQSQQMPSYQQPVMQELTPQPMNTVESGNTNNQNLNSKPPKKTNLGLIIGIVAAIIVIAIIIGIVLLLNNKGDSNNSNSIFSPSNKYVDGKIPYNKEVNKCAKEIVSYKDNTRQLCYQEPIYYNAENYYDRDYARFIDFSFYLNTDEKNILSFKLDKDTKEYYNFIEMGLDEENLSYVYEFQTLEEDTLVFVSNQSFKKYKTLDLTNKESVKTSDNKELYKGVYAEKYTAYEYYTKIDGIEVAITVVNKNYNVDEAYSRINKFIKKLSKDNGAPFIVDYAMANYNTMGFETDLSKAYMIKDYKYVTGLKFYKTTGSYVNGNTGLNLALHNKGITYTYDDYYLLVTDDYDTYTVYRTEMSAGTAEYSMWSAYIPEDNVFSILINVWNGTNIISRFGFVVKNPDMSKGYQYYIDNFSEMLTNGNGNTVGKSEEYHRN